MPFQRQTTTTTTKALALDALALEVKRSPQEEATLNGFMRKTEKTLELMMAQIHALQLEVQELKGLKERETETETGQGGSSSSSSQLWLSGP